MVLRDYQIEAVHYLSQHLRCAVRLPTASGKSAVITAFILHCIRDMKIWKHFIILVPTKSLVVQFRDDMIKDYGIDPSMIGVRFSEEKTWDYTQKIFVTTRDSLYANKEICEYLKDTYCIMINDECHTTKSDMVSKIIERTDPAAVVGLTGTMPDKDYDYHCVVGNNGPVVYERKTVDLQEQGYLPGCKVTVAKVTIPKPGKMSWDEEKDYIRNHKTWQFSIVSAFAKRVREGKNCLGLVHNEATGIILQKCFEAAGIECTFFSGSNSTAKQRQAFKPIMENSKGKILLATYGVFSTGISIKNLQTVSFLEHAPGACTLIQAIGRGLRNHKSKVDNDVEVLDVYASVKYSMKHRLVRKKSYDVERFEHHEAVLTTTGDLMIA
jgi:superfamily II DNA or RNA helicase